MVYLKNDFLSLEISENGAEIVKAQNSTGEDIIWIGDEKFWSEHSPVLFPICGTVLEDKYTYKGKTYNLKQHGFAKRFVFEVESSSDTSAVFLLKSNEETKKIYPFDFELRIEYTLLNKKVKVDYIIDNKTDGEMLFSIGSHEGYMCKAFEDCVLEFDREINLKNCKLSGPFLNGETESIAENCRTLSLGSKNFWAYDLIFKDIDFKALTVKNSKGEKIVRAEFEDFPNLLIWSQQNAPYICVEAWHGLPDYVNHDGSFENKAGLIKLEKGETKRLTHSFEI